MNNMSKPSSWDLVTDIVVVGSGGGGLAAALFASDLGANVIIFESAAEYGGTTAYSGGVLWIPNNYLMRREGINDSIDDAFKYLRALCDDSISNNMIMTYLNTAPSVLRYLEDNTVLVFRSLVEYPDYYPELPGGKPGGRTVEPIPIDGKKLLGEDIRKLRKPPRLILLFGRATMTITEIHSMALGHYSFAIRRLLSYYFSFDWFRYGFDTRLTMGLALIGGLKHAINNRKIPIYLTTKATKLIVEDKEVIGVVAKKGNKELKVKVKRGVIIASGGFSKNEEMLREYLGGPDSPEWSAAVDTDLGDCVKMAIEVGAKMDRIGAWWIPITIVPGERYPRLIVVERKMPASIIVNRDGKRFVNEAAPFMDVAKAMRVRVNNKYINFPAFLIMDSKHRRNYICGPLLPGKFYPEILWRKKYRNWIIKSYTLEDLAEKCGINKYGLMETIKKFNEHAAKGVDPEYHRGESIFDNYYGDPGVGSNPNLAPLDKPPYYAIKIYPGKLGTKGGIKTDEKARVISKDDDVISGLYAVGNCTSTPFGDAYPGSGASIGPAIVFAYLAVKDCLA